MKKEKIEELFNQNALNYSRGDQLMDVEEFTSAINQAELEWYKKLEEQLIHLENSPRHSGEYLNYREEIQGKIKELK